MKSNKQKKYSKEIIQAYNKAIDNQAKKQKIRIPEWFIVIKKHIKNNITKNIYKSEIEKLLKEHLKTYTKKILQQSLIYLVRNNHTILNDDNSLYKHITYNKAFTKHETYTHLIKINEKRKQYSNYIKKKELLHYYIYTVYIEKENKINFTDYQHRYYYSLGIKSNSKKNSRIILNEEIPNIDEKTINKIIHITNQLQQNFDAQLSKNTNDNQTIKNTIQSLLTNQELNVKIKSNYTYIEKKLEEKIQQHKTLIVNFEKKYILETLQKIKKTLSIGGKKEQKFLTIQYKTSIEDIKHEIYNYYDSKKYLNQLDYIFDINDTLIHKDREKAQEYLNEYLQENYAFQHLNFKLGKKLALSYPMQENTILPILEGHNKTIEKFDISKNYNYSTYAIPNIKHKLQEEYHSANEIIKMPQNYRKTKNRIQQEHLYEMQKNQKQIEKNTIIKNLDKEQKGIYKEYKTLQMNQIDSLDEEITTTNQSLHNVITKNYQCITKDIHTQELYKKLKRKLYENFKEKHIDIYLDRYEHNKTTEEISLARNISINDINCIIRTMQYKIKTKIIKEILREK